MGGMGGEVGRRDDKRTCKNWGEVINIFITLTVLLVYGICIFVHIKTYQTVPFYFFCHAAGLWDISSPSGDWTWALAMKELSPNH